MSTSAVMACYDNPEEVYFTLQNLLIYHKSYVKEIVVVNANPNSPKGIRIEGIVNSCRGTINIIYDKYTGPQGTSGPRNRAIELATKDVVVCMDSHVLMHPRAFMTVEEYFSNPNNQGNIVSGPLIYDNQITMSTHFDLDQWGGEMWGRWATDEKGIRSGRPFSIPAQGLGAFAVYKGRWLGFNKDFRGFGGEEGYIHEKYRKAGGKSICLPEFKWTHFFGQESKPYPLYWTDKVRNYVIGFTELGLPLDPIYKHFVQELGRPTQEEWDNYYSKGIYAPHHMKVEVAPAPKGCGSCNKTQAKRTLEEWYDFSAKTPSDINEHVPKLKELASKCEVVVEFGVRTGVSTAGLLAGKPKKLLSFDINKSPQASAMTKIEGLETEFEFKVGNSLEVEIPECDLIFIDTKHTFDQCYAELQKHGNKSRRYLVFHDTEIYGTKGEDGGNGLLTAIQMFISQNPHWGTAEHFSNNYGLTVLSRLKEDLPPDLPSMLRMAYNYGKSEVKDLSTGRKRVSLEVQQERYAVCTSNGGKCPVNKRILDLDRCAGCGCHLVEDPDRKEGQSKTGKTWRPYDSCPFGFWASVGPDKWEEHPEE